MSYSMIIAADLNGGIGKDGKLPWHIKEELAVFRTVTKRGVLIMGRKTLETLPVLKGRKIVCMTRRNKKEVEEELKSENDVVYANSAIEAYKEASKFNRPIFVAGGAQVYAAFFQQGIIPPSTIYYSEIQATYDCDTSVQLNFNNYSVESEEKFDRFCHKVLKFNDKSEWQYLNLLKTIHSLPYTRETRNGFTSSIFSPNSLRFDIRRGFPAITTKKLAWKTMVGEFLFFLRGDTNTNLLKSKKIWEGNTNREFLDKIGKKDRKVGFMGPMYGYQWRFFNAPYDEETGKPVEGVTGFDQLAYVVDTIKKDPHSRRILLTAYNPAQAFDGVLFPCHSVAIQFYTEGQFLDMRCFIRSSDVVLGLPFNIASSALLLTVIALMSGRQPRELIIDLGDTHIYEKNKKAAETQIKRLPYTFPSLTITNFPQNLEDIKNLKVSDFVLENYMHHARIVTEMQV